MGYEYVQWPTYRHRIFEFMIMSLSGDWQSLVCVESCELPVEDDEFIRSWKWRDYCERSHFDLIWWDWNGIHFNKKKFSRISTFFALPLLENSYKILDTMHRNSFGYITSSRCFNLVTPEEYISGFQEYHYLGSLWENQSSTSTVIFHWMHVIFVFIDRLK